MTRTLIATALIALALAGDVGAAKSQGQPTFGLTFVETTTCAGCFATAYFDAIRTSPLRGSPIMVQLMVECDGLLVYGSNQLVDHTAAVRIGGSYIGTACSAWLIEMTNRGRPPDPNRPVSNVVTFVG